MNGNPEQPNRGFFKALPKVELHRHLEGSLRLSTMIDLAKHHKLDLPYQDVDTFRHLVQVVEGEPYTFQNFLSKFSTLRHFYQSPKAIKRITYETIEDAASDNIRYLELRFTPVALTRIKGFPLGEAMDWVIDAVQEASLNYSIQTVLIASVNRHEPVDLAEDVIRLAMDRRGSGILGLDLAGNEAEFPGEEFGPIFREAKQEGMKITIHGGEWGGPDRIRLALDQLGADRIGHGVNVLKDPDLIAITRERAIPFEVCPTSNFQSGVVDENSPHPLRKMYEEGLSVTVNTDDPGISQIDLSGELALSTHLIGFSPSDLKELTLSTAQASFLPAKKREFLIDQITAELDEYLRG